MTIRNFIKSTLMLTLLFTSSASFAQKQAIAKKTPVERTPAERAENQAKWMKLNLATTDDQNKKAYEVILDFAKKISDIHTSTAADKKAQTKQAIENKNTALKSILTAEQFQKYMKHTADLQQINKKSMVKDRIPVKH